MGVSSGASLHGGSAGWSGGGGGGGGGQVGGVSALCWFPGRSETAMTIAVGCLSGRCFVARCTTEKEFEEIPLQPPVCCTSPVLEMEWAPAVGRRFLLLAICSRREVVIVRFNVISPSFLSCGKNATPTAVEIFRTDLFGACGLSWSKSASMVLLASDDSQNAFGGARCLQMRDPSNHQSWEAVYGPKA